MAELLDEDPLVIIRGLLAGDWDATNTSLDDDPRIHTGWWDWRRDEPVVTVTNAEDTPTVGGDTGYAYLTGDGRAGQRRAGFCLVNCWAGTFDSDALGDVSPKVVAWEMCREVRRILLSYPDGTTTDSGDVELLSVAPGTYRRIVESDAEDEHPTLFRYELEARYTYLEES